MAELNERLAEERGAHRGGAGGAGANPGGGGAGADPGGVGGAGANPGGGGTSPDAAPTTPLTPTGRVILGMIALGKQTGYDIKQLVDRSVRFFWAASYGQIYPELRRLEVQGLIAGRSEPAGRAREDRLRAHRGRQARARGMARRRYRRAVGATRRGHAETVLLRLH